jgi:hypothetical protein
MTDQMLQASIDAAVAPDTILTAFQTIERWSSWYPGVVAAAWVAGAPWQTDAVMAVQVRNSLGMLVKSTAVVLPATDHHTPQAARSGSPDPGRDLAIPTERLCCWENRAPGLVTVCYAWAEETAGGSRFTLQKFYRGPAAPLLRLMKGRQEQMLQQALRNLRAQIAMDYYG